MTALQIQLATLIIKELIKGGQRLAKVGEMNDAECLIAIPLVQANIDANDEAIMRL